MFYGWYLIENFYGELVIKINGLVILFVWFDGENLIDFVIIENEVEYMEKGIELVLDIIIFLLDVIYKDLRFEIRE